MKKQIITVCIIIPILVASCSVENDGKSGKPNKTTANTFEYSSYEDIYFDINDQYNTEEVDYSSENDETGIILPREYENENEEGYQSEKTSYSEEREKENYDEDIDDFNINVYKGIINDINNVMEAGPNRRGIINNLQSYEVTTFEVLYAMHDVLYDINEDQKNALMKRLSEDQVFVKFFENAPRYSESTIIATIFQTLSFVNMNIKNSSKNENEEEE